MRCEDTVMADPDGLESTSKWYFFSSHIPTYVYRVTCSVNIFGSFAFFNCLLFYLAVVSSTIYCGFYGDLSSRPAR